eukprot:scaffold11.g4070.t1
MVLEAKDVALAAVQGVVEAARREAGAAQELAAVAQQEAQAAWDWAAELKHRMEREMKVLRHKAARASGMLNMRGAMETIAKEYMEELGVAEAPPLPRRKSLWKGMVEHNKPLAACLEAEAGWAPQAAAQELPALHRALSKCDFDEFQASIDRVDIEEGVVTEQQAKALQCICQALGLDSAILKAEPGEAEE